MTPSFSSFYFRRNLFFLLLLSQIVFVFHSEYLLAANSYSLSKDLNLGIQVAENEKDTVSVSSRPLKVSPLPAFSYSPELGFTFGVTGIAFFDLAKGDSTVNMSSLNMLAIYTTRKQILTSQKFELYFPKDKYRLIGELAFLKFPDRHYGIGNDSNLKLVTLGETPVLNDTVNYMPYSTLQLKATVSALRKVSDVIFVGIKTDLHYVFNYSSDESSYIWLNGLEEISELPIAGFRSGLGLQFVADLREHPIQPLRGQYIAADWTLYGRALGSDFTFSKLILDARQYINTYKKHVLAIRLLNEFNFSNADTGIPLHGIARLGGNRLLRGYYQGSFQDHHLSALQLEYRLPIIWRIGFAGYCSAGQTYGTQNKWSIPQFNWAIGGGLRFSLNKSQRTNVRIDYGVGLSKIPGSGKRQSGFYLQLGETF